MGVCLEKTCKQARQKRRLTTRAGKENKQNEMKEKENNNRQPTHVSSKSLYTNDRAKVRLTTICAHRSAKSSSEFGPVRKLD
jgi:hypothetical protein